MIQLNLNPNTNNRPSFFKRLMSDRAVQKSFTWRIIAIIVIIIVSLVATGDLALAWAIGFWDTIVKTALYFAHEKAWEKVEK